MVSCESRWKVIMIIQNLRREREQLPRLKVSSTRAILARRIYNADCGLYMLQFSISLIDIIRSLVRHSTLQIMCVPKETKYCGAQHIQYLKDLIKSIPVCCRARRRFFQSLFFSSSPLSIQNDGALNSAVLSTHLCHVYRCFGLGTSNTNQHQHATVTSTKKKKAKVGITQVRLTYGSHVLYSLETDVTAQSCALCVCTLNFLVPTPTLFRALHYLIITHAYTLVLGFRSN